MKEIVLVSLAISGAWCTFISGKIILEEFPSAQKRDRLFAAALIGALICFIATATFYDPIWMKAALLTGPPYILWVWYNAYHKPNLRRQGVLDELDELRRKALSYTFPSVPKLAAGFIDDLKRSVADGGIDTLPPDFLATFETIAEQAFTDGRPLPVPSIPEDAYERGTATLHFELTSRIEQAQRYKPLIIRDALIQSAQAFLAHYPNAEGDQFSVSLMQLINVRQTVIDMAMPFYQIDDKLNLCNTIRETYGQGAVAAQASQKARDPVWPDAYKGDHPHRLYLIPPMAQLFEHDVPYGFSDEARFRHQWVIGDTGSGKTTFLSAMIADDLVRVAKNEASVFVMDSQNELIPDIANLKLFAPGQPLHDKLIYLEPDPDHPLALNIFDVNRERMGTLSAKDRMMLESGAMWMVEFFLSSLVKAEASPHQDTFLNYVIPALMVIPDATIFTFKELLEPPPRNGLPPGYERYKQYFGNLRRDTQQWLAERMHSNELAPTRNAIRARLDGFTARGFFHDMFEHPRNKLDLFKELQSSKVILVNTMKGLLKSGTEPFGRYFIARLVQAMEERMFLERGTRMPVFAYLDEASDYIAEEENVEELIDKARKQRMGFIFANQRESQITSPTVRDALSRAAIQCRGEAQGSGQPPIWHIGIDKREPVQVSVPNVRLQDMPRMAPTEYEAMMQKMRSKYCAAPMMSVMPPGTPISSAPPPKSVGDNDPTAWG